MSQAYRVLAAFVRRVHRGVYARRLLQSWIVGSTLLLALLLLGIGVQQLIPFAPLAAPVYTAFTVLVLLGLMGYVIMPALRPLAPHRVLMDIERTYPELHDDLTNALELDPDALQRSNPRGIALELVRALHQQTARKLAHCRPREVIHHDPLRGIPWCGALFLTAMVVTLFQPQLLAESVHILFRPLSYLPPGDMRIVITPEHTTIARGTNVEIRVHTSGRLPHTMHLLVKRQGQPDRRYPMEAKGQGTFRHTFLKPQTSFTFYATTHGFMSPPGTVEVVPAPAIGRMVLRYHFPDYTGLQPRIQEGGGDIQALAGTQVQITMQANVPLTKGSLRFDDGSALPLEVTDSTLQGNILVMKAGSYVVEVEDTHGLKNPQPPRYMVQVLPDLAPRVHIRQPQDGIAVDETTSLQIRYEAEDDFGMQDAALIYFGSEATEHRIVLHQGRFAHRRIQGTFTWDMRQWPLPTGDTVHFYLEVYDNDTISGPKRGQSPTLTLKVHNRQREHEKLKKQQDEIANALLDLLGDHLELAEQLQEWRQSATDTVLLDQQTLDRMRQRQHEAMAQAEQLANRLQKAFEQVQQDPYSTYETLADIQALQRNMAYLQHTLLPQLHRSLQSLGSKPTPMTRLAQSEEQLEEVIQELERLSSLADTIASGAKLADLLNMSTKMMEQQNQLLAALDNLPRDLPAGKLPPEIQQLLDKLDALMQTLTEVVAQLPTTLPDEFLNHQLSSFPLANMMHQLQKMRQKLGAGDLAGAKKLAAELLKALSTMVSALRNMQQQARGGSMDAMSQQLQQASDRLADLVQRQEHILEETRQIDQQALHQLNQVQRRAFHIMQQPLQHHLSLLSQLVWDLAPRARQHPELTPGFQQAYQEVLKRLRAARKHVAAHNIPRAVRDLESVQRQLATMQRQLDRFQRPDGVLQQRVAEALQRLHTIRQHIANLPQNRQAMLTPEQQGQLGDLAEQQGSVREDTQHLHQTFENLLPLLPFLPTEMRKHLQEAVPFMGQAEGKLEQRQSQPAIPPEQQALEQLRRTQNSLQQALQQMAQRGQMMGMSLPLLQQTGRLPYPMPPSGMNRSRSGVAGVNVRNFQLPDKEAYKVPPMFREDIMEALKEGYPKRYKGLIEQYYRNIVR